MSAYKAHLVSRRVYNETYAAYIEAGIDEDEARECADFAAAHAYDIALEETR